MATSAAFGQIDGKDTRLVTMHAIQLTTRQIVTMVNQTVREFQCVCHTLTLGLRICHPPNMVRRSSPKQGMLNKIPFQLGRWCACATSSIHKHRHGYDEPSVFCWGVLEAI